MKAVALLADYAVVADRKLTIVGGGWTVTGPHPTPFAIAIKFEIPWHEALDEHKFKLELIDPDGQPVLGPTPQGMQPIVLEGGFKIDDIGSDVKPGTPLDVPFAMNSGPLPLPPGKRFEWRLSIDGEIHEDWTLPFSTRPLPRAEAA